MRVVFICLLLFICHIIYGQSITIDLLKSSDNARNGFIITEDDSLFINVSAFRNSKTFLLSTGIIKLSPDLSHISKIDFDSLYCPYGSNNFNNILQNGNIRTYKIRNLKPQTAEYDILHTVQNKNLEIIDSVSFVTNNTKDFIVDVAFGREHDYLLVVNNEEKHEAIVKTNHKGEFIWKRYLYRKDNKPVRGSTHNIYFLNDTTLSVYEVNNILTPYERNAIIIRYDTAAQFKNQIVLPDSVENISETNFGCHSIPYRDGKEVILWAKNVNDSITGFNLVTPYPQTLYLLDASGNIEWEFSFRDFFIYTRYITTIAVTPDGSIIGGGTSFRGGDPDGYDDKPYVFKISPHGEMLWETHIVDTRNGALPPHGYPLSIGVQSTGHIVCAGIALDTVGIGELNYNTWVFRLDADGCITESCNKFQYLPDSLNNISTGSTDYTDQMTVYPNPMYSDRLTIEIPKPMKGHLMIYDVNGKQQYQEHTHFEESTDLKLPNLIPGVYIILFIDNQSVKRFVSKFIKI